MGGVSGREMVHSVVEALGRLVWLVWLVWLVLVCWISFPFTAKAKKSKDKVVKQLVLQLIKVQCQTPIRLSWIPSQKSNCLQ